MQKKTLKEIAEFIGGELIGDGAISISGIRDIKEAGDGDLAFLLDLKFEALLDKTKASCVIVPMKLDLKKIKHPVIRSKNPALAFAKLVNFIMPEAIPHPNGVSKNSSIGKNVSLGEGVAISPYVFIADETKIGKKTVIYPFCYIGKGTKIGNNCIIYPNVSIRENVRIGNHVIIHAGSVIGSDGFGYDNSTGVPIKIPHIGGVIIEDDVEVGACVTVDRAKFADTKIGRGTKIDNLVQIAHNVEIGENCIVVAQSGISGSCKLGKHVILGGQVGLVDHVSVGDYAIIASQSGISKSVPPKFIMFGSPARTLRHQKRVLAVQNNLPEIYERIKRIEKALNIKK